MSDNRIILHVDMELYRCVSDEVMEILRRFSNIVEQESIDEAFCYITEVKKHRRPWENSNSVKKLQISGYPISEHGNCRYFEGKRKT